MPWRIAEPMTERRDFIQRLQSPETSFKEVCAELGISRKTGYKWLHRYEEHGLAGLHERSRAPLTTPWSIPERQAQLLLEARVAHPKWGPRKLIAWLKGKHTEVSWPAPSTVGELLKRHELVPERRRRTKLEHAAPSPFDDTRGPNEIFCIDFKGWFRTGDGRRCNPLTVTDAVSRYLLCCQHLDRGTTVLVRAQLERVFREYGLPRVIHSDNGAPFGAQGLGGLSQLSLWLMRLGIQISFIEPGKPQQNGRHERMHRTLQAEVADAPAANLRRQQRAFDDFRYEYNWERPHEALGQRTPGTIHVRSRRSFPPRLPEPEYPNAQHIRRVRHNGQIRWKNDLLFVGEAFIGQPLGIEETDDGEYAVRFCQQIVGKIDETARRVR
jgi:transposase InsO family protein